MVGDEWLSVGPIKCYSDGTLIGCTAAFNEPYLNTGRARLHVLDPRTS